MCKQVTCPNDGKPTWWGCGTSHCFLLSPQSLPALTYKHRPIYRMLTKKKPILKTGKHVEQALASIPPSDRCDCPHEPASIPGMYEVKKNGPPEGVQLRVGRAGADVEK